MKSSMLQVQGLDMSALSPKWPMLLKKAFIAVAVPQHKLHAKQIVAPENWKYF